MFDFLQAYPWALPLVIFFGRICDVTLGTLRIIFVSKGEKMKAPFPKSRSSKPSSVGNPSAA